MRSESGRGWLGFALGVVFVLVLFGAASAVRALIDQLGEIGRVLDRANREDLAELYDALRLTVEHDHRTRVAVADDALGPPHVCAHRRKPRARRSRGN